MVYWGEKLSDTPKKYCYWEKWRGIALSERQKRLALWDLSLADPRISLLKEKSRIYSPIL